MHCAVNECIPWNEITVQLSFRIYRCVSKIKKQIRNTKMGESSEFANFLVKKKKKCEMS